MSLDLFDEVPSLDLADFLGDDPQKKNEFVEQLGRAYNQIGFAAIKNHYLSEALTDELYGQVKKFFDLPDDVKEAYEIPEYAGQRGYVGKGREHAKDHPVADLKEFFHVGQEVLKREMGYPDNLEISELDTFLPTALEAYRLLEKTGVEMLRAIALYLGLDENYFDDKVRGGNSILRPIHYFPIENPELVPKEAVRAAAHGDINLITVLMGASAEGLQILRRDGEWIGVTALPDHVVVNVGDMMERFTNGKLRSTIHRVVNPPIEKMRTSRYSIPFFMHPISDMDLTSLESCIDDEHPKQFEDISAGDFLEQRLREIGLRK